MPSETMLKQIHSKKHLFRGKAKFHIYGGVFFLFGANFGFSAKVNKWKKKFMKKYEIANTDSVVATTEV